MKKTPISYSLYHFSVSRKYSTRFFGIILDEKDDGTQKNPDRRRRCNDVVAS
jgi:hypothetical protein